ncbi:MAG: endonuclease MutS2 [Oscillospiraceae bacterium]|nr:endonuclease MutS2 [Oscillospiraceae bacterium]
MNRHFLSLELDKILQMLSDTARSADAKEIALAITPQSDFFEVQRLLDETEAAYIFIAKFGAPGFSGLQNVNNAVTRAAAGATLSAGELLKVAQTIKTVREITVWHEKCAGMETVLDDLFNSLYPNKYLEDRITNAVLSETEISDNASADLKEIRRKMRHLENKIREQLDSMIHSSHYSKFLRDSIVTQRNGRFVVPVKNEHRGEVSGMVHDTSGSGATVFIEPQAVVDANNEIKVLQSKEKDEIERILSELSVMTGEFQDTIKISFDSATALDIIFAKAHLAYKMKASRPILNADGEIYLKKARHPLIDPKKVVPVDISLGSDFDSLVITGANTGGKTVSIKTIGLLTAMAECGFMLPVSDNSKISAFKNILADIGDEQSIEQSLSTFSSHMTNIVNILNIADDESLVLIDELGAGTDPVEGAALAVSILENLRKKGSKIASTTHYSELKEYALKTDRVENGCCEFDVNSLKPTYRLLIGMPGRSNALAIALRLGIDGEIIDFAKTLISEEDTKFENAVDSLETARKQLEDEKQALESEKEKIEKEKQKALKMLSESEEKSTKEIERAKYEAERIVENAKRAGNSLLLEIEQLKKEQAKQKNLDEIARKAKRAMREQMDKIDDFSDSLNDDGEYVLPRPLKIGDRVKIQSLGNEGEVISIDSNKNTVFVQSGFMKLKAEIDDIRLLGEKKQTAKQKSSVRSVGSSKMNASAASSVDLRGKTVEEAMMDLDMFIDSVLRSGLNEITIIHGKGTGALRKGIHVYLRKHPNIRTFRVGTFGEGEEGVTIAEIK